MVQGDQGGLENLPIPATALAIVHLAPLLP